MHGAEHGAGLMPGRRGMREAGRPTEHGRRGMREGVIGDGGAGVGCDRGVIIVT